MSRQHSRRTGLAIAAILTTVLAACEDPLPDQVGPTLREQQLIALTRSTNALQQAIDLAVAQNVDAALALLAANRATPRELRIEHTPAAALADTGDSAAREAALILEHRYLAADRLMREIERRARAARDAGDEEQVVDLCQTARAIVEANKQSSRTPIRAWSRKWESIMRSACP